MTNSTKTTKYSAIFLAAILVAGTIALSNSSFMVGAQAQQFNGMDQRYNSYEPDYGTDNNTIAMNQNMEWTAMTSNHMEKIATATINPKIVVVSL